MGIKLKKFRRRKAHELLLRPPRGNRKKNDIPMVRVLKDKPK